MNVQQSNSIPPSKKLPLMIISILTILLTIITFVTLYRGIILSFYLGFLILFTIMKIAGSIHSLVFCYCQEHLDSKSTHYFIQIICSIGAFIYFGFGFHLLTFFAAFFKKIDAALSFFFIITLADLGLFIAGNILSYMIIAQSRPPYLLPPMINYAPSSAPDFVPPLIYYDSKDAYRPPVEVVYGQPVQ